MAPAGPRPIRSRTQEAQPSAQAYTQQHRRRFTSAVPDSGSHDISTAAAVAVPAYRLIKNPVWQPQPAPPNYVLQAQPLPSEAYAMQQQYQQPAKTIATSVQSGSKRPRLTAEPVLAQPPGNAAPYAASHAEAAAQDVQHQQQLQQQPDLQHQLQALPTAAQSRFEQLCQLAAVSPEASSYHQHVDASVQLPTTATLMPGQTDDMRHLAAVGQPETAPILPPAEAAAAVHAASMQSTSQERAPQPTAPSAQGTLATSRCMMP